MSLSKRTNNLSSIDLTKSVVTVNQRDDTFEPHRVLERIEILTKKGEKNLGRKQLAQILHEQADSLQLKGDYETALIVYHRAATIYPRDISHNIAVRNTSTAICSATNPQGILRELMQETRNPILLMSTLSPETPARLAEQALHYSGDPYEDMKKILQSKIHPSKRDLNEIIKSKMMSGPITNDVTKKLYEMKRYFMARDWKSTLNLGNEFLIDIKAQEDTYSYQVAVHRYMALSHLELQRHDRAVSEVSRMIQAAKKSGNEKLISRSFAVLGRVHLKFAHLDAAAKAWHRLSNDVNGPILKAWLQHEIGRCYFEMSDYSKALKMSRRCIESSTVAKSIKWMSYGKLLNAQSLIELGRLSEALEALKFVAETAKNEIVDLAILNYVEDLINNVAEVLQKNPNSNIQNHISDENISASSESHDGNSVRSNGDVNKQKYIDISPNVLSLYNEEQESSTSLIRNAMGDSIVNKKKSQVNSYRVIDKWKEVFCNGNDYSKSKFDLMDKPSNGTITLNANISETPRILRSIGDSSRTSKWTCAAVKSKKLRSTKSNIKNDWKKMSQESVGKITQHQFEQAAKFSACALSPTSAITTSKTFGIARSYPLHRHSLRNSS